ncbi:MAG: reverse transcriptase/maturase family protein, partial [Candidatus Omnitrophota bacterium]
LVSSGRFRQYQTLPLFNYCTMARTFNNLYERIYAFENLYSAYLKARRNKRYRPEVLEFSYNLEENLLFLRDKLKERTYHTGKYKTFYVYDPKKRMIFSLPFRDRVVQHALCNIIEPIFDARFIADSYACRKDRGTHKAVERLTDFLRRTEACGARMFCLKGDVEKYFPSVHQGILLEIVRKKIRCARTMRLVEDIVRSMNSIEPGGKGIPIGNLTSQLLANVYLNELDYFVKQDLRCRYYLRYMDDFVILSADKKQMRNWQEAIEVFLDKRLCLRLNKKSGVFPVFRGIDFLGYRVWRTHRLLRKSSVRRIRRTLKVFRRLYARGRVNILEVRQSVASWLGHMQHANCYHLRRKIFGRPKKIRGDSRNG